MRLGLVVARNVAVPTRDVGGGGEAERGRERSTLATKKLFARILIPGGKSNSLPARSPAHSAESRAGLASYVLLMSGGLVALGKALVHADIVSSAILTCINSWRWLRKCQLYVLKTS